MAARLLPVSQSDRDLFNERGYIFNHMLGEGSYAKVWLCHYSPVDPTNNQDNRREFALACKIINTKKAAKAFVKQFLPREMDILMKINHPHLIHLHSIYLRKNRFFIFMRFAEKGDLLDHILAHGEVEEHQARLWSRQISLGLQYLHMLDIVHRDIKCENILITANNNVKLADFGFSRFMVDITGKSYLSKTFCGSLAYAAPEILRGRAYDPKRSDVWSMGVVMYVMLNQTMPFENTDLNSLFEKQVRGKWSFRPKIAAVLSEAPKHMVHCMLEPDINKRYTIHDVVYHRWFDVDDRLRTMSKREQEALDYGMNTKKAILPRSHKISIPILKKLKRNEAGLICITEMRCEESSYEFTFETVLKSRLSLDQVDRDCTKSTSSVKSGTREGRQSRDAFPHASRMSSRIVQATGKVGSIASLKSDVGGQNKSTDRIYRPPPGKEISRITESVALLQQDQDSVTDPKAGNSSTTLAPMEKISEDIYAPSTSKRPASAVWRTSARSTTTKQQSKEAPVVKDVTNDYANNDVEGPVVKDVTNDDANNDADDDDDDVEAPVVKDVTNDDANNDADDDDDDVEAPVVKDVINDDANNDDDDDVEAPVIKDVTNDDDDDDDDDSKA